MGGVRISVMFMCRHAPAGRLAVNLRLFAILGSSVYVCPSLHAIAVPTRTAPVPAGCMVVAVCLCRQPRCNTPDPHMWHAFPGVADRRHRGNLARTGSIDIIPAGGIIPALVRFNGDGPGRIDCLHPALSRSPACRLPSAIPDTGGDRATGAGSVGVLIQIMSIRPPQGIIWAQRLRPSATRFETGVSRSTPSTQHIMNSGRAPV